MIKKILKAIWTERKKMIEQPGKKKMLLFSGSSNVELAQKVASNLGTELSKVERKEFASGEICLLYTSPSPRDATLSRMPSSA